MAGINAALYGRGEVPCILSRSEAYIGVLIDDLITKGKRNPIVCLLRVRSTAPYCAKTMLITSKGL